MRQITVSLLAKLSNKERADLLPGLASAMNEFMPQYLEDNDRDQEHFLAQALHEADGFHTLQEYASGDAYDTRTDLGNTKAKDGDGRKYKGRGIFQNTGKHNYEIIGDKMGIDGVNNPELFATPRYAVWSALIYWKDHGLSKYAAKDDIKTITKRINGGYNGLADRKAYLEKVKAAFASSTPPEALGMVDAGSSPDAIKALQQALNDKKYNAGAVDGKWGKMTRDAILSFKADNHLNTGEQSLSLTAVLMGKPRVLEMRKTATVETLRAKGSTTVEGADKVQVASLLGGAGALGSSALSNFETAGGYWSRVKSAFEPFSDLVPEWLLTNPFLYVLPIAALAFYYAWRVKQKRVEEFKAGKIQ